MEMDKNLINEIHHIANEMRKDIALMTFNSITYGAHLGGAMSATDILAVLYTQIMRIDIKNPRWKNRDRFIMSKAHCVITQYAALKSMGLLSQKQINRVNIDDPYLSEHPKMNLENGIEFSGGSLGQGLPLGVGTALALRQKGNYESRIFVMVGDGECDEGAIWEAAAFGSHNNLNNLTIIIDNNTLQNDGPTKDILCKESMTDRWKAFGYEVIDIDGHDIESIYNAFMMKSDKPVVINAHTVKGKGVSFAENVPDWHYNRLSKELYDCAIKELEAQT